MNGNFFKNRRNGFTVVEISIAAILLSMVFYAGYRVFFGVSVGFQKSTRALAMQNEMRNGLNYIREEMQRASYHSEVKLNRNVITRENYKFLLCKEEEPNPQSSQVLAQWKICKPFNNRDGSGVVYKCILRCAEGKIYFTKVIDEGSESPAETITDRLVMKNIVKIKLTTEDFDVDRAVGSMINIEMFASDDKNATKETSVSSQTGAKVEVDVERMS